MTNDDIINFLYNEENIHNCDECPYNEDMENYSYPCGQQSCWVQVHCER